MTDAIVSITEGLGQPSAVARVLAGFPRHLPAPSVAPASVRVYARTADQKPNDAMLVAEVAPGMPFELSDTPLAQRDLLFGAMSVSIYGTINPATKEDLIWHPLNYTPTTATAAGFDPHVPVVTKAPTVAKAETADEWVIFTPAPDAYGSTVTDGELRVRKADDLSPVVTYAVAAAPSQRVAQTPFDAKVDYRWRNQSAEEAGDGRGWSAWSPAADAAGLGSSPPPPASAVADTFVYDENDSRAGTTRGVLEA